MLSGCCVVFQKTKLTLDPYFVVEMLLACSQDITRQRNVTRNVIQMRYVATERGIRQKKNHTNEISSLWLTLYRIPKATLFFK